MEQQTKLAKRQRVAQILDAALALAERTHYAKISREQLAAALGWRSPALITYHMGTMEAFRRTLMREAVKRESLRVIAQGIACRDRHAMKAAPELQDRALQSLSRHA